MKEISVINKIDKLVENLDYKSVYIEIQTRENKFMLEKNKQNKVGFDTKIK